MKRNLLLIVLLTSLSLLVYLIQYLLFQQSDNTIFYFLQDLAFVPIQVLMVTIIINRFLNILEKQKKTKKINVIISTFFVEAGTAILASMSEFDQNKEELYRVIQSNDLSRKNNIELISQIKSFPVAVYAHPSHLEKLSIVLAKYRSYMLNMLGNDNLLEHDSFTDMLWATFHVNDELQTREDFTCLDESDMEHLAKDILRAYVALCVEWVNYMGYLHEEYPFLYATATKHNPFVNCKN